MKTKDNACYCELRQCMTKILSQYRYSHGLTQDAFSEQLMIDRRTYARLEKGETLCCTLTFLHFLIYCCEDTAGLLADCKKVLDNARNKTPPV